MKIYKVSDYRNYAITVKDAQLLIEAVSSSVTKKEYFTLDFENIKYFSHTFFLVVISKLIGSLGRENYLKLVTFENLTSMGHHNYNIAYNYYCSTSRT